MKATRLIIPIVILLHFGGTFASDFDPTQIYIDEGACPGEWCGFGYWTATEDIPLYEHPANTEDQIGTIKNGQTVKALTGNAYVKPQKYVLAKESAKDEEGKIIWVLTYQGEGFYKVWLNGKVQIMELGFSPYGPDIFLPYEEEWWVKFVLPNGVIGWAKVEGGFKNYAL